MNQQKNREWENAEEKKGKVTYELRLRKKQKVEKESEKKKENGRTVACGDTEHCHVGGKFYIRHGATGIFTKGKIKINLERGKIDDFF